MTQCQFAAVWFDLDGTLLDTAGDLVPAINATLSDFGHPTAAAQTISRSINFGARGMFAAALDCPREDPRIDAMLPRFGEHYAANLYTRSQWYDGMESIIAKLEAQATPWGIVTNKAERFAIPLVAGLGLDKRIAGLVCGDTTDESKPSAKPLLYACAQAGHNPQHCLYVGDNSTDIIAGHGAGMTTAAAAYGYVPLGESAQDWGAEYVLRCAQDLAPILWPDA